MPESSNKVNWYLLTYIYCFVQSVLREKELGKALPERISYDMDGYEKQYLNDFLENGWL